MRDELSTLFGSLSEEVGRLNFKIKQAHENKWEAKANGETKRLEACENAIISNEVAKATLEWVKTIIYWQKEESGWDWAEAVRRGKEESQENNKGN